MGGKITEQLECSTSLLCTMVYGHRFFAVRQEVEEVKINSNAHDCEFDLLIFGRNIFTKAPRSRIETYGSRKSHRLERSFQRVLQVPKTTLDFYPICIITTHCQSFNLSDNFVHGGELARDCRERLKNDYKKTQMR